LWLMLVIKHNTYIWFFQGAWSLKSQIREQKYLQTLNREVSVSLFKNSMILINTSCLTRYALLFCIVLSFFQPLLPFFIFYFIKQFSWVSLSCFHMCI
jgi:hypothetical protein